MLNLQEAPDRSEIEATPVAKPARVMLGDMDWIKVHALLAASTGLVSAPGAEPKLVAYREGWSDKRIADEVGGTATEANVLYRREKHFGKLPPRVAVAGGPDPRIDKLREDHDSLFNEVVLQDGLIQQLTAKNVEVETRFNKLILALKMSHGINVTGLLFEPETK